MTEVTINGVGKKMKKTKNMVVVSEHAQTHVDYFKARFKDIAEIYVNEEKQTTVIFLIDKTKGRVQVQKGDTYSVELGLTWAYIKAKEIQSGSSKGVNKDMPSKYHRILDESVCKDLRELREVKTKRKATQEKEIETKQIDQYETYRRAYKNMEARDKADRMEILKKVNKVQEAIDMEKHAEDILSSIFSEDTLSSMFKNS